MQEKKRFCLKWFLRGCTCRVIKQHCNKVEVCRFNQHGKKRAFNDLMLPLSGQSQQEWVWFKRISLDWSGRLMCSCPERLVYNHWFILGFNGNEKFFRIHSAVSQIVLRQMIERPKVSDFIIFKAVRTLTSGKIWTFLCRSILSCYGFWFDSCGQKFFFTIWVSHVLF